MDRGNVAQWGRCWWTAGSADLLQSTAHLGWLKANVIATAVSVVVTYLGIQLACLGFTNYALGSMPRSRFLAHRTCRRPSVTGEQGLQPG
jgi:hypothetical protein